MADKIICRICLGDERIMHSINSSIIFSGENVKLSYILENFYNYKVTNNTSFPESICINCVHQLTITYSFKLLMESSLKTLSERANLLEPNYDNYENSPESDDQTDSPVIEFKKEIKSEQLIKSLYCVECKEAFSSVMCLKNHCSDLHPVKRNIGRSCEYCHEKFEDFSSLVIHRKLHFKPYICNNCWAGFYTEDSLSSHNCQPKKKRKEEKSLHQCHECGKTFPLGYLRVHIKTHSSEMPYSCKYCPKKFKVPGGLTSHVLWNHKRTRDFKCEVCNATFISASARSAHVRKRHLNEKNYCCDSCGKSFFSKSEIQRHMLTHTGVKNFHCHLCDKSYQTRHGLNMHLKSHSQNVFE